MYKATLINAPFAFYEIISGCAITENPAESSSRRYITSPDDADANDNPQANHLDASRLQKAGTNDTGDGKPPRCFVVSLEDLTVFQFLTLQSLPLGVPAFRPIPHETVKVKDKILAMQTVSPPIYRGSSSYRQVTFWEHFSKSLFAPIRTYKYEKSPKFNLDTHFEPINSALSDLS